MPAAPIAIDEPERLAALHSLGLLDSPPEERFDRITRIAATALDAPIALVTLVDAERQWFKACIGLGLEETPRSASFCAHAIQHDEPLVIEDASTDPLFADNPLVVGPPHIRFYAGQALHAGASRHRVGTLCVIDVRPRSVDADSLALLRDLADIAERELAAADLEAALEQVRASERRLSAIMASAAEAIVLVTPQRRVAFANPAAARSLGMRPEQLPGEPIARFDGADGDESVASLVDRALATGASTRSTNVTLAKADGARFPAELTVAPVERGHASSAVITFSDITERRELDLAKDEFVSSVSHELRTPLTAVKGFVEFLLDEDAPEPVDRARYLNVIYRNVSRLEALINDLLTLSRLESGRAAVTLRPVDARAVAHDVAERLEPIAAAHEQAIEVRGDAVVAAADEVRLEQMLTNLVGNALKFSPRGARIRVRVARSGRHASIEVVDEGVGIPADELPKLGTRFFRASTAARVEGTGLGLAVTRELAERHGGRLEIESEADRGSTFRLLVPLARTHATRAEGFEASATRYLEAMRSGDYDSAHAVAMDALDTGVQPVVVMTEVIAPAMRQVGELWETGELTTADEHLATAISERVLADIYRTLYTARPLSRETLVVACVQGESHVLGSRMVGDVLEGAGFRVVFLGADVPHADLVAAIERHGPAAVLLGATSSWSTESLTVAVSMIRSRDPELPVLVGGPAATAIDGADEVRDAGEVVAAVEAALGEPAKHRA